MKRVLSCLLAISLIAGMSSTQVSKAATIKLNKTKVTLTVGKTCQLKLKGTTKKIKWTSSKKSVATVSSKGKVKAKKIGNATISARVSGKKYRCKVTVKAKATTASNAGTKENPLSAYEKNTFNYYEEGKKKGKFTVQLLDFITGDEATALAAAGNPTNPIPTETQEYIYFKFEMQYVSGQQSVNAKDLFNYYENIYGDHSSTVIENIDWGFSFELVDDLYSTVLQPGNDVICAKAILVEKGHEPYTYRIQTGKNSYTWFTTE